MAKLPSESEAILHANQVVIAEALEGLVNILRYEARVGTPSHTIYFGKPPTAGEHFIANKTSYDKNDHAFIVIPKTHRYNAKKLQDVIAKIPGANAYDCPFEDMDAVAIDVTSIIANAKPVKQEIHDHGDTNTQKINRRTFIARCADVGTLLMLVPAAWAGTQLAKDFKAHDQNKTPENRRAVIRDIAALGGSALGVVLGMTVEALYMVPPEQLPVEREDFRKDISPQIREHMVDIIIDATESARALPNPKNPPGVSF